jgi:hypothetical protein
MKKTATILATMSFFLNAYSQCIEKDKISYGGDWSDYYYTFFCPTYEFSFDGDPSKTWNIVNDPIDINQVASKIFPVKKKVESQILKHSGQSFLQDLKFLFVQIVYPDSLEKFNDRMPFCNMDSCKAKYFFYYNYSPIENANYHIGIAVNDKLEIVNEFNFPSKDYFKPIDKGLTMCKLIEISKKYKEQIEPIEEIKFEYNPQSQRFIWIISQGLVNENEGINKFNELIIDASNSANIEIKESEVVITY